jgi:hypothetical protein
MILTDYYKFEHTPGTKSKLRMDCTASTGGYPAFEEMRNKKGALFIYLGNVPDRFAGDVRRKADKSITNREGRNVSSVFVPDVSLNTAYGDVRDTQDAIMIVGNSDYTTIEIFVARGYKNNRTNLWQNLTDGEYDDELSGLRERAVTDSVTGESGDRK